VDLVIRVLVVIGFTAFLLATSGKVVFGLISLASHKDRTRCGERRQQGVDVGFLVGKCENLLVVAFVLAEAYTALGLIFAAKAIVRREDMRRDSLYFLAGTMINFTYSVLVALLLKTTLNLLPRLPGP